MDWSDDDLAGMIAHLLALAGTAGVIRPDRRTAGTVIVRAVRDGCVSDAALGRMFVLLVAGLAPVVGGSELADLALYGDVAVWLRAGRCGPERG